MPIFNDFSPDPAPAWMAMFHSGTVPWMWPAREIILDRTRRAKTNRFVRQALGPEVLRVALVRAQVIAEVNGRTKPIAIDISQAFGELYGGARQWDRTLTPAMTRNMQEWFVAGARFNIPTDNPILPPNDDPRPDNWRTARFSQWTRELGVRLTPTPPQAGEFSWRDWELHFFNVVAQDPTRPRNKDDSLTQATREEFLAWWRLQPGYTGFPP